MKFLAWLVGGMLRLTSCNHDAQWLMLEYASSLQVHPSLWAVSASYLASCGPQGYHYLEAFVERIPLSTDHKAQKVLHLCQTYGLHEQAVSICKVIGRRALDYNRVGSALQWFLRAKVGMASWAEDGGEGSALNCA